MDNYCPKRGNRSIVKNIGQIFPKFEGNIYQQT